MCGCFALMRGANFEEFYWVLFWASLLPCHHRVWGGKCGRHGDQPHGNQKTETECRGQASAWQGERDDFLLSTHFLPSISPVRLSVYMSTSYLMSFPFQCSYLPFILFLHAFQPLHLRTHLPAIPPACAPSTYHCIYLPLYLCIHLPTIISVYTTYHYLCIHLPTIVSVYISTYHCICIHIYLPLYVYTSTYHCICIHIYLPLYLYTHLPTIASVYTSTYHCTHLPIIPPVYTSTYSFTCLIHIPLHVPAHLPTVLYFYRTTYHSISVHYWSTYHSIRHLTTGLSFSLQI